MNDKPFPGSESTQKVLVTGYKELEKMNRAANQSTYL